ncbi:MAG: universal stress protein [Desulfobacterota bacterium]|jgi:universal stress protein A|nr:universal stress protein [Thermodesulfobacteriota bacterium]
MLPLKKIVCPTDFSDPSFEALQAAVELARHFAAELVVIHVVQPIPVVAAEHMGSVVFNVQAYQEEMEQAALKKLQQHLAERLAPGLVVRLLVALGDPADQIVRAADEAQADLIVIATRGQTGFKRLVFGSVAEKVVRLAGVPVLSIRGAQAES